jgi:hypothetical protein
MMLPDQAPTVAGFLYSSIASVAACLTVSAIRWAILDTIHHRTGLSLPNWDFAEYPTKAAAFDAIAEDHYRYYQFYSNSALSVGFVYVSHVITQGGTASDSLLIAVALAIETFLFVGSRDALREYYVRGSAILGIRGASCPVDAVDTPILKRNGAAKGPTKESFEPMRPFHVQEWIDN